MAKETYYIDGAAFGNPGFGGYGIIKLTRDNEFVIWKEGPAVTTNNQMEMIALFYVLQDISENARPREILILSDSMYVVDGVFKETSWSIRPDFPNQELWIKIWELYKDLTSSGIRITIEHVRGHSGNAWNEVADAAAKLGASVARARVTKGKQ